MTHRDMIVLAHSWLRRQGCHLVGAEMRAQSCIEAPDALGWKWNGPSLLIECKVSRADFLTDKKKAHKAGLGIGQFRYYAAPRGLIQASELPAAWGLLEVVGAGLRTSVAAQQQESDLSMERVFLIQVARFSADPTYSRKHLIEPTTSEAGSENDRQGPDEANARAVRFNQGEDK